MRALVRLTVPAILLALSLAGCQRAGERPPPSKDYSNIRIVVVGDAARNRALHIAFLHEAPDVRIDGKAIGLAPDDISGPIFNIQTLAGCEAAVPQLRRLFERLDPQATISEATCAVRKAGTPLPQ
jgi:hypothetical protein